MTDSMLRSYQYYSTTTIVPFTPAAAVPLLDAYTDALAAYSFRKLSASYAGSAVRIRRSSDDAETDIGFSGSNFNSAAAAAHIGGGSGFITKWYDQSGNGDDLVQATAADQPNYIASGVGGLPSISCVALSTVYLKSVTDAIAVNSAALSTFAVGSMTSSATTFGRLVALLNSGDTQDFNTAHSAAIILRDTSNNAVSAYQGNVQESIKAISLSTASRIASIFDATNNIVYVNGSAGTTVSCTNTLGSVSGASLYVGAGVGSGGTPSDYWDGLCGEVVIWDTDQTANRTGIDANQSAYWGI